MYLNICYYYYYFLLFSIVFLNTSGDTLLEHVSWLTKSGAEQDRYQTIMLLQHSMFCAIPPSHFTPPLKQRNPSLHRLPSPRKPKASTLRISSLGAGFFDDIVQIAHNKVPHFEIQCLDVSQTLGIFQNLIFPFLFGNPTFLFCCFMCSIGSSLVFSFFFIFFC